MAGASGSSGVLGLETSEVDGFNCVGVGPDCGCGDLEGGKSAGPFRAVIAVVAAEGL